MDHAASIPPDPGAGHPDVPHERTTPGPTPSLNPSQAEPGATTARERLLAALLLAAFALQAFFSLQTKSATFDEPAYLAAGNAYLTAGRFDLNAEHPPLAKLLFGVPLRLAGAAEFDAIPGHERAAQALFPYASAFLYANDVEAEELLLGPRLVTLGLALLLGLVVWRWAGSLGGPRAGLFALGLFAFSPNLLAHGRLATLDVPLTAALVSALYAGWRFLERPTLLRGTATGALAAAALLIKHVAVVVLPLLVAAAAWRADLARRRHDAPTLRSIGLGSLAATASALLLIAVAFGPTRFGLAEYWEGFRLGVLERDRFMVGSYRTYFLGELVEGGHAAYFPVAFLLKTPIATLALLIAAIGLGLARPRVPSLATVLLVAPFFLLLAALAPVPHGIGLRYLLPAYPLLFIVAGLAAARISRARVGAATLALLGFGYVLGTLRAYPDYLPYFHEIAGGSERGPYLFDGSNVDWGQDVGRLAEYVYEQELGPVKIMLHPGYLLDRAVPHFADGREPWASPFPWRTEVRDPKPGWYAVSAHLLVGREVQPGSGVRFDWLERFEPAARIGDSILLYRFD